MSKYLKPKILKEGFEKYNTYKYFYGISTDNTIENILAVSEIFDNPFDLDEEDEIIINGNDNFKVLGAGTPGYVLLQKTEEETEYPENPSESETVFFTSLGTEGDIQEDTEKIYIGNIKLSFGEIEEC